MHDKTKQKLLEKHFQVKGLSPELAYGITIDFLNSGREINTVLPAAVDRARLRRQPDPSPVEDPVGMDMYE